MANDTSSASEGPLADRLRTVEQVFRALPPLGSPQYIEHISSATAESFHPKYWRGRFVNYRLKLTCSTLTTPLDLTIERQSPALLEHRNCVTTIRFSKGLE
jgi:hypothetical protein